MPKVVDKVVKFKLGKENFAISVDEVKEVIKIQNLTMIPNSPPHVDGIMDLRGVVCTIIDPKKILHINEENNKGGSVIVLDVGENTAGIRVDEVYSVDDFTEDELDTNVEVGGFTKGIIRDNINEEVVLLIWLDVEKLVGDTKAAYEN